MKRGVQETREQRRQLMRDILAEYGVDKSNLRLESIIVEDCQVENQLEPRYKLLECASMKNTKYSSETVEDGKRQNI